MLLVLLADEHWLRRDLLLVEDREGLRLVFVPDHDICQLDRLSHVVRLGEACLARFPQMISVVDGFSSRLHELSLGILPVSPLDFYGGLDLLRWLVDLLWTFGRLRALLKGLRNVCILRFPREQRISRIF